MNFGSEARMAQANFANARRFTAKAADFSRALLAVIAEDVRTWDAFKWAVIVLLAINLLLLLSLAGLIRSEIAALEQDSAGADQLAHVTKDIADMRASLTQALSDMNSGLQSNIATVNTKIDAKIDALLQQAPATSTKVDALLQQAPTVSPPSAASPKISAKPRPASSRSRWPW
jgi:hypothetical protein